MNRPNAQKNIYENIFDRFWINVNQIKYVINVATNINGVNIRFQLNNIQINIISGTNRKILTKLEVLFSSPLWKGIIGEFFIIFILKINKLRIIKLYTIKLNVSDNTLI